jgi:hypothetical protein
MEIFNCVLLTGNPGYAWRIKKKFSKIHKPEKRAPWCKFSQPYLHSGKQVLMITCFQPININREILNFKYKYNIEVEVLYSDITVKIPVVEQTFTGSAVSL